MAAAGGDWAEKAEAVLAGWGGEGRVAALGWAAAAGGAAAGAAMEVAPGRGEVGRA